MCVLFKILYTRWIDEKGQREKKRIVCNKHEFQSWNKHWFFFSCCNFFFFWLREIFCVFSFHFYARLIRDSLKNHSFKDSQTFSQAFQSKQKKEKKNRSQLWHYWFLDPRLLRLFFHVSASTIYPRSYEPFFSIHPVFITVCQARNIFYDNEELTSRLTNPVSSYEYYC